VSAWSWTLLLVVPVVVAGASALIWLGIHYFSTLAAEQQDVEEINPRDFLKNRRVVNVYSIENYSEAYCFRDITLFLCYSFFAVYAVLVALTPCSGCNTPYKVVAVGATVCYVMRIALLWYHLVYFYSHFKTLTKELFAYQHGFDKVGESRMFNAVIPDLYWPNGWWWSAMIDAGAFVTTLALAVLGSIWVSSNECALGCTRLFNYSQYLVVGVFVLEGVYIVSSLLLRFYRRASGVEAIQDLINHIVATDRALRLEDKAAAGAAGSINRGSAGGAASRGSRKVRS